MKMERKWRHDGEQLDRTTRWPFRNIDQPHLVDETHHIFSFVQMTRCI